MVFCQDIINNTKYAISGEDNRSTTNVTQYGFNYQKLLIYYIIASNNFYIHNFSRHIVDKYSNISVSPISPINLIKIKNLIDHKFNLNKYLKISFVIIFFVSNYH